MEAHRHPYAAWIRSMCARRNLYTRRPGRDALWHEGRGQHRARRSSSSLKHHRTTGRAARQIAAFNAAKPRPEEGPRADAGEVRHLLHPHPPQPGGRAGACLYRWLGASEPWRHRDGAGALYQGGAGGGRGIRHRCIQRAHHRHDDRQGAQHLADRRLLRHRPQRHGGEAGGCHHQGQRIIDFAAKALEGAEVAHPLREWPGAHRQPQRSAFGELAQKAAHGARISLSSTGFYATPKITWDRAKAKGRPFFYFAYGAACRK